MSNLRADKVGPSAGGTLRDLPKNVAAAWVNLKGDGTVTVRASNNVSSVTDMGVGDYQANHTANMASANYGWTFSSTLVSFISLYAANYHRMVTQYPITTQLDAPTVSSHVLGDLA